MELQHLTAFAAPSLPKDQAYADPIRFPRRSRRLLVDCVRSAKVKIAMVTVPAASAQDVTDKLVQAGVKAILNYAPITLTVPSNVRVQYIDPVVGLQRMTYYLS